MFMVTPNKHFQLHEFDFTTAQINVELQIHVPLHTLKRPCCLFDA